MPSAPRAAQAAVLFDIARGMAAHPAVASRVEITRREIRTPAGWLKVVASDGPKQHGLILSLAIVDELHAHRDAELYIALRTGMLKRKDARMVTLYRFEGPDGPMSVLDLFEGRRQLIVHRAFYGPEVTTTAPGTAYPERACLGCSHRR